MKSFELRKKFFDFFVKNGHEKVASSSLIPAADPTLLFANAGMNQFKDVFLGKEKRSYTRAVTIQKCVRAGGKHNDLDNVGFTQRHLTFFEMMGNFSFGDYFKKEAIAYAWEFLTKQVKFPEKDLYVTVHHSDDEAYAIWHTQMGIPKEKIFRLGADNFWQMGDTGPCGPCTEIFVDRSSKYGCGKSDCSPACGCDRFIEVWNNVFMQFNRQADGTDVPLTQTGVDTGMGLERLTMLVQKGASVFDTDLFRPIFDAIEIQTGHVYTTADATIKTAFNVLGDHIRSSTFLIADGCAPANDGRGYVLRKIIRRAALFSQKLSNKTIFPQLALVVVATMKDFYPELALQQDRIVAVLYAELERFSENLVRGTRILHELIAISDGHKKISGQQAFMLYDTYGFPLEVTQLLAQEAGFIVDNAGFEMCMEQQRQKSGKKMKQGADTIQFDQQTIFTGYEHLREAGTIVGLVVDDQKVEHVALGQECWIVADKSPFYVACGGQINDQGTVWFGTVATPLLDLKKVDAAILMRIQAPVALHLGDAMDMQVDQAIREHTMKNHTATHLLQAALQQLLGGGIKQAGSLVTPDYLRFDFTHHQALTADEIKKIEALVNQKIWKNIPVVVQNTTYKKAVDQGVSAFFGDKYNPESVRAILIDTFSKELCGGTHVSATGAIGVFKIVEETALAAGQRRITAYTGARALAQFQQDFFAVKKLSQELKVKPDGIVVSVEQLQHNIKDLNKELQLLKKQQIVSQMPSWLEKVQLIHNNAYLSLSLQGYNLEAMREIAQMLNQKKPGLYFLLQVDGNKATFLAMLDKHFASKIDMKQLQALLQDRCGLRGGGNQVMLQGAGAAIDIAVCDAVIKEFLNNV